MPYPCYRRGRYSCWKDDRTSGGNPGTLHTSAPGSPPGHLRTHSHRWCEDTESFYLFLKGGSNEKQAVPVCFVIGKKDFDGAKDFRELCTAVMAVRIGDNND